MISLGVHELNAGTGISLNLVKLLDGRLLIQGASGAGKSWTLRRLMEQSAGRIQQIIVDPEGEFVSLAEELGYLYIESRTLDGRALGELARGACGSTGSLSCLTLRTSPARNK